jgi:hypothetical protein
LGYNTLVRGLQVFHLLQPVPFMRSHFTTHVRRLTHTRTQPWAH